MIDMLMVLLCIFNDLLRLLVTANTLIACMSDCHPMLTP